MKKGSKLTLEEWRKRMNELTVVFLGRSIWSYEGINWDYLHATGCRPLEVFDALMEELRTVDALKYCNDGMVNV
jgi:hypothetical protein